MQGAPTYSRDPGRRPAAAIVGGLLVVLLAGACRQRVPTRPPTAVASPAAPVAAGPAGRAPVGVTSRVFEDTARHRRLATTIWYPAVPGTVEHDIEWDGIFIGRSAWDVPLRATPRRFPVVLLSHGSGADGSNLVWLAEALAARGYVAVAMDHPGDRFGDASVEGRFAAWRRPRDVTVVLDRILADPDLGPRLDRGRIAAAGHSSGAYTVLALAGARLKPSDYLIYCEGRQPGPDCKLFVDLDLKRIPDLAQAGKSWRDRRVRAVLALAPVLGPAALPPSLRTIAVPVVVAGSPSDEIVPFALNAARYQRVIPRSRMISVPGADHFVFMPLCTLPGRIVAAQVCVDRNPDVDRKAVHERIAAAAVEFFDRRLGVRRPPRRLRSDRDVPGQANATKSR